MARARANKEPGPADDLRAKAHETLDAWLDQFEPTQTEPPTLFSLSMQMLAQRQNLLGPILSSMLQRLVRYFGDIRQMPCPHCERRLYRKRMAARTVQTLHGPVHFERPYFHCADCQQGYSPFDEALEMCREVHQYDIQERLARLAASMPYEEAVEHFESMTGQKVGTHLAHNTVTRIEQALAVENVLPEASDLAKKISAAVKAAEEKPPVVVVAVDGAFAPIRPAGGRREKRGAGYWREVKGFRIYLTHSGGRIIPLMSWHQIETAEELTRHLEVAAARLPPELELPVALVADGAGWIWTAMQAAFPAGRQILDYYHCAEHVWEVAHAHYEDPSQAQDWAESTLVRLSQGWISEVLGSLTRMLHESQDATEAIKTLRGYLDTHRDRLDYQELKQQGLPRGSGAIESANKYLVHGRLKRSGAWWLEGHGNGMLRIRCAIHNETFIKVFHRYMALARAPPQRTFRECTRR
jgi:hypothetical protein